MYLNLGDELGYCTHDTPWPDHAWVITSMRAEGRFSVDMDATGLGNGCSPSLQSTEVTTAGTEIIGPRP